MRIEIKSIRVEQNKENYHDTFFVKVPNKNEFQPQACLFISGAESSGE